MVEGHSVHRVAALHRRRLVGKRFTAYSPNGRFTDGAKAINGKLFYRIEAIGKNLFAFFGDEGKDHDIVVVHVHFGMAGNWAVYDETTTKKTTTPPEPTSTNRLRLECPGIVADLSAMTVQHGGMELYNEKRSKLGEDPLREDANPEKLWERVKKSTKSIGALIMDQSYFTGPGNIYRCEILFKSGIHPDIVGNELTKSEFDLIWYHTVSLLQRGFETGSILTVDKDEAIALGNPKMRRYIYNTAKCPRCQTSIKTWQIASRTCYACTRCQPLQRVVVKEEMTTSPQPAIVTPQKDCIPFNSHCAQEPVDVRLHASGPSRLTVQEIKSELARKGIIPEPKVKKAQLVKMLEEALISSKSRRGTFVSSEDAAAEKAAAGESLAVEHIAELAPSQARKAREHGKKSNEFSKMTVNQLKRKLDDHGVDYPSKASKSHLIELVQLECGSVEDEGVLLKATECRKRQVVPITPRKSKRVKK